MKKFFSLIIGLILLSASAQAMNFKIGFWSKNPCQSLDPQCLPQPLHEIEPYEMIEPDINSARRLVIQKNDYTARLLWAKRDSSGGYYSFQMELYDKGGVLIAQCSRYESLDTFETAPVGSCSGTDHNLSKIVGISLYLP